MQQVHRSRHGGQAHRGILIESGRSLNVTILLAAAGRVKLTRKSVLPEIQKSTIFVIRSDQASSLEHSRVTGFDLGKCGYPPKQVFRRK